MMRCEVLTTFLIMVSIIIFACVVFNRISSKLGVPMLLAFLLLGMIFGSDGFVKIEFNDFIFAEQICTVALIFIMFYGGFGTKWSKAKPVAIKAIALSSFGTVLTAVFVGLFCNSILKIDILESFLIGAVISSTDAASVFSILRSNHLNLKNNTASILELESGSNDPFAYMLTVIVLSLMGGNVSTLDFSILLFQQIFFGLTFGVIVAFIAKFFIDHFNFTVDGFDVIFIVGIALTSYSVATFLNGNGYLSVYITGLLLGNQRLKNKQSLVHFFDAITGFMQILLFFLLGLLSFPSHLLSVALPAISIFIFLTFIARPLVVFLILKPFKSSLNQILLISWSGMRGAASIVFAIMTVTSSEITDNDIFHIVFFVVLLSILVQGSFIPFIAKFLKMKDDESDVMKTFNDYIEESDVESMEFVLPSTHNWNNKAIKEIIFPPESVLVLVVRNGEKLLPNGNLILNANDILVLVGKAIDRNTDINLYEKTIKNNDYWIDKSISEIKVSKKLIVVIKRNGNIIIPTGNTEIKLDDIVVINDLKNN